VELTDASGNVIQTIDANEIAEVRRAGQRVTLKRRKGRDVAIEAASLDDAGRLELALRSSGGAAQPVAVKKGGGIGRFALIGCGGLLALAVIAIALVAVAGGGDDDESAGTSGSQSQAGTSRGDVHVPLAVGASGEIAPDGNNDRRSKVIVLEIQDNARSTNQFSQPPAGKRYYALQIEV
jgi:hypothetical protein